MSNTKPSKIPYRASSMMASKSKYAGCSWCKINMKVEAVSAKAVRFGPSLWIPKSQIKSIEYDLAGDSDAICVGMLARTVCVPTWFAEKENLAY